MAKRSHTRFNSGYDFDNVTGLINAMHGTGKVAEAYWRYVEARAEALVEQHWWNIDAFAQALLKHGLIAGDIRAFFILAKSCAGNRVRGSKLTAAAKLLTRDEARRVAANIVKPCRMLRKSE